MRPTTVPFDSAALPLAVGSFLANRILDAHVRSTYAWGDLLRTQAHAAADVSGLMGAGVLRDAVSAWGRMHELVAESITDAASRWGRRHGHLAFAVPVPAFRE